MKVGIAGFGTAGRQVAQALLDGRIAGAELVAVAGRDLAKAARLAAEAAPGLRAVPLAGLPALCDVVVETATGSAFPEIARTVLEAGKDLICVSAGGFLAVPDIEDIARRHGARIRIATGAMPGLDMLRCAAEGTLHKVALKTSIKPESLANEPYVLAQGLDFRHAPPPEPVRVFSGTAREAARHFPRHMNVAVAISLAGIGFDRTTIDMWMDPSIPGAIHELAIDADEVCVTFVSRNFPSSNPKTSRIVAPSILAALRARQAAVLIGS